MSARQFHWTRIVPGAYHCKYGFAIGIIEKSIRGWWWWAVIDSETGEDRGGGRRLKLIEAKEAANKLINAHSLKVLGKNW